MIVVFLATFGAVFIAEIVGDKLLYTTSVLAARFSNDGSSVITSAGLKFEIPRVAETVPAWLIDLAESITAIHQGSKSPANHPVSAAKGCTDTPLTTSGLSRSLHAARKVRQQKLAMFNIRRQSFS